MTSSPESELISVDLPTPDEPSAATVRLPVKYGRSSSTPSPVTFETAWTGTPTATASTSATAPSTSSQRSAFVSTTTGWAPLSQASTR